MYYTSRKAYTNSVPDQNYLYSGGEHTLAIYTKCVTPMGYLVLLRSIAQEDTLLVTRLHLPPTVVVSLHEHEAYAFALTPETADSACVFAVARII